MLSRTIGSPLLDKLSPTSNAVLDRPTAREQTQELPRSVRAWEMADLFDQVAPYVSTLSLDCFDTLLWRNTRTPVDVFYELQRSAPYVRHSLTAKLRIAGETKARGLKLVEHQKPEVTLRDIYQTLLPRADSAEIEALCLTELEAELAACFPFPHAVELIRRANRLGHRVIVVSDTYFTETELRTLLSARLPKDVYSAIGRVFCSNTLGRGKASGLFRDVLEALREKPERIFHVGDNHAADLMGARQAGLLGVQLDAFEEHVAEVLRQSAAGSSLCAPEIRGTRALPSPYHGLFAQRPQPRSGAHMLGYLGSGPILFAFAHFIKSQIDQLTARGKRVRPVFLMRDGHLPQRVFAQLFPDISHTRLSISRFVAYASSFVDRAAVVEYLGRSAGSTRYEAMLKQLLVPEKLVQSILKHTLKASRPQQEFVRQVLKPHVLSAILDASNQFRARLFSYLEREVGIEAGDTLLFIDLGYEGTAQRCLGPVLLHERDVSIFGCYVLAASVPGWELDRAGLLDPAACDDRTLSTLIPYVAVLEDICSACMPSVRGYTQTGEPEYEEQMVSAKQFEKIEAVQEACLHFARDAAEFFASVDGLFDLEHTRSTAAGFLARLLFFPSLVEVDYLDGFTLDMGLGTKDVFPLFDQQVGRWGLRKRGLFFMEHGQSTTRMSYPIELRSAAYELALAVFAQKRFCLDLALTDLTHRRLALPVLVLKDDQASTIECIGQATFDGCFAVTVPVGACDFDLGFLLGRVASHVQLLGVDLIPTEHLYSDDESRHTRDLLDEVRLDGLESLGAGVLYAKSDAGFAFISSRPHRDADNTFALRITIRPLSGQF